MPYWTLTTLSGKQTFLESYYSYSRETPVLILLSILVLVSSWKTLPPWHRVDISILMSFTSDILFGSHLSAKTDQSIATSNDALVTLSHKLFLVLPSVFLLTNQPHVLLIYLRREVVMWRVLAWLKDSACHFFGIKPKPCGQRRKNMSPYWFCVMEHLSLSLCSTLLSWIMWSEWLFLGEVVLLFPQ